MIPPLNEHGYLPAGAHQATLDEIIDRFGMASEVREAQAQSLRWLLPLCRAAGIVRRLLNGSFVTDRPAPNDVDCVAMQGPAYRANSAGAENLRLGLPFIELKIVNKEDYDRFKDVLFATDRDMIPKGVVEVLL